jgi:hypothetical protein
MISLKVQGLGYMQSTLHLKVAHAKCKGAFDKNLEILHSTNITYLIGLIIHSLDEHPLVLKCLHVAHAKCKGAFDKNFGATGLAVGPQNMEEPLGLPLSKNPLLNCNPLVRVGFISFELLPCTSKASKQSTYEEASSLAERRWQFHETLISTTVGSPTCIHIT